jgi:NAD(P)-dependent dehydrogenase (short-subunit alcohol dehydrogenase family)
VTLAFAAHLVASGRGRFVIVSSPQAQSPTSGNAAYAAAKAAGDAWLLALADRLKGTGATANIVSVGAILTPAMRAENPEKPFPAFTPAEEIADTIAFLVSDASASMSGQRVVLVGAR